MVGILIFGKITGSRVSIELEFNADYEHIDELIQDTVAGYVMPEWQWDFFKICQVLDEDCMDLLVPLKPPE